MLNQYLEDQLFIVNDEGNHPFCFSEKNSSTPRTRRLEF